MTAAYRPGLTLGEASLIEVMEKHAGKVLSREQISMALYGDLLAGRSIDQMVKRVRQKLGTASIVTVRQYGYTLGQVHRCEACAGKGYKV